MDEKPLQNHGPRILVVDDEESLRELLSEVLSEEGYQVTTAPSAEQALSIFNNDPFPLVITDIRMEGMTGIQLLEKVKAANEDSQVVIITSHASLDSALNALRAGAYDYLIKPFDDLQVISAVVGRALEKVRLVVENRYLVEKLSLNNKELEEANSILREIALRDGLTGLYNHRYFQECLAKEIARSVRHNRSFSLVFFDVDHFKHFNDSHGHLEGDKVLRTLGKKLLERLRQTDMACRYGGEEFVMLLPETGKDSALLVAELVRKVIETHPFDGGHTQPLGKLSISLGVASFPEDGTTASELLVNADKALYKAKSEGRNRVCAAHKD